MKYKETGFRPLYHHFCAFKIKENEKLKECSAMLPGSEDANCVLTYGYFDENNELMLEVVANGKKDKDNFGFSPTDEDSHPVIRAEELSDREFTFFPDKEYQMAKRYDKKVLYILSFDPSDQIGHLRDMDILDANRDPLNIDNILVHLRKNELSEEMCWVRITGMDDHFILGVLLNEPRQNFGYHEGEIVAVSLDKDDKDCIICVADLNPSVKLTRKDLEDGKMLKESISALNRDKNRDSFINVMELLRDSFVIVPCIEFEEDGEKKYRPDIMKSGNSYYFPAFSSKEEMEGYGEGFMAMSYHMLDVVESAKGIEKALAGIVINGLSEPFIVDKELFDVFEKMRSKVIEDTEEN